MKPVLSALTLGVLASLSGCGYLMGDNGYFRDRAGDYQQAEVKPRMTVPADLESKPMGDLLPVPGQVAAAPQPGVAGVLPLRRGSPACCRFAGGRRRPPRGT